MYFTTFLELSTLLLAGSALGINPNSADRYIPGPFETVSSGMLKDMYGGKSVGEDGVLRSFANNGTVLDYHQLDPDQVKEFGEDQLSLWSGNGEDAPDSVTKFAKPPYPDGRLVTSLDKLLHPAQKPEFAPQSEIIRRSGTSPAGSNSIMERQPPLECVGRDCQSVSTCLNNFVNRCSECYFPNGPPNGRCRT